VDRSEARKTLHRRSEPYNRGPYSRAHFPATRIRRECPGFSRSFGRTVGHTIRVITEQTPYPYANA